MEEDRDSDSDDEIEYSGMIQPPLIKQLRTILSEYPDDGQILKEIIQNAEDAGAQCMKILYDDRPVVQSPSTRKAPFRKYFAGPALLVYNDAKFSEEDWRGIKMLYSSIKEFDRTKVGRFGLGFKSVFHITDYPLIISGDQLLVLDPHQDSSKVCQTMKLKKLHKYKKMKVEDCLEAFSGVFGFSQNTLDSGNFPGTILRFPLRKEETELSDNIYDKSKVEDLFMSFKDEAAVSLLFLKCLESITLLREEDLSKKVDIGEFYFSVYIDETTVENVRSSRDDMKMQIKDVQNGLPSRCIENSYFMTICVKDDACNTMTRKWKVRNLFQGENNMSSTLRRLSCDESLSYSPYVGVAMEVTCPVDFQGHVFCFLPLPSTEKSLSGLPIHVNGFFALSQNRCVVKWPTADQIRNHAHTDKSIQWNQVLVKEVLSDVYCHFLRELVEESCLENGELNEHRRAVSHCIPNKNLVDEHWKILIPPLVAKLKEESIFFTPNEGGKWIPKSQAIFFRPGKEVDPTIRKILEMYDQNTVDVEDYIWETMELQGCQEVTPDFINKILRTSDKYMDCTTDDKFSLLRYLLSSNQYNILEGLCLLPLQNGSFIKFNRANRSTKIFKTSRSKMQLLVGMEDHLLQDLPTDNDELFSTLISKGMYQVQFLNDHDFIDLLKKTVGKNIGEGQCPITWNLSRSSLNFDWLERIWKFLAENFQNDLERFQYLPLIPEERSENEILMHALTENLLVGHLSENIALCLKRLSIKVLSVLPKFIMHHSQLKCFIPEATVTNTINAINAVRGLPDLKEKVMDFNNNSTGDQKEEFLRFLCKERRNFEDSPAKHVYKSLKLFQIEGNFVNIMENCEILSKNIPVPYPSGVIHIREKNIIHFATQLGAKELKDVEIFSKILTSLLDTSFYSNAEMLEIMKFVIGEKIYTLNDNLFQLTCRVPFVTTGTNKQKAAADLFDPEEKILCKLISDQSQFPAQNVSQKEIKVLRKLGLKSSKGLTATDIYKAALEVHRGSMENNVTTEIKERQLAIFKILSEREELLNQPVKNKDGSLRTFLMGLEIVEPLSSPTFCIPNLQWYNCNHYFCEPSQVYSHHYGSLIGHVAPVIPVNTQSILVKHLGGNREPHLGLILQQHSLYVENYQEEYKSEYLLPVKQLYQYLAKMQTGCQIGLDKMWMGDGFVPPNQIYINSNADDINIKPYLIPLPKELQTTDIKQLASRLGCMENQTAETLVSVLQLLKQKHEQDNPEKSSYFVDLDIVIRILNKLKNVLDIHTKTVPIPIHTANKSKLEFRAASECNYCNAEWLKELAEEEGESMYFIHEDISSDTAAKLGVPSLTENLLSETEGIQEWGQKEPLTRRIKNLLKDYKDGFAVPKELVQNADDAKATKVCFLYDQRENKDCQTRLIDEEMKKCQGPALWSFNDALFTPKDLENITKLSGATKADDLTKIGKFGLGFCSVYNLTDVPSFITGSNMVIFDPHARYIGKAVKKNNPGLKIDLTATKNKILLRRMKNQFKPFNGIFGCNLNTENPSFDGTLFRFPFRTKEQLFENEISEKAYDENEIKGMIELFLENAGNLLLFTQHVEEIEFYHLSKKTDTTNPVLLHRVSRNMSPKSLNILSTFGKAMKYCQMDRRRDPEQILQTSFVTITTEVTQYCYPFYKSEKGESKARWFISWASGTSESLEMGKTMLHLGALPLASTAVYLKEEDGSLKCSSLMNTPKGFYKKSHLFCYLPLPVNSPFPLHINGSFAISSNRRQLSSKTSDDKNDIENEWNKALLSDALVNAYINLIENLDKNDILCENYYELWPAVTFGEESNLYNAFYETFYCSIIERDSRVFRGKLEWIPLSRCLFLDPELKRSTIGEIATEATRKYREDQEFCLVSLDQVNDSYLKLFGKLPQQIQSRIISVESFYLNIFLENIDDEYWSLDIIKALVGFALDKQMKDVHSKMQSIKCIPTAPNGKLKMPCELVKTTGKVSNLFCEEDERFPVKDFHTYQQLSVLQSMGMMTDEISDDLLIERITSVEKDAKICSKCGIEKCRNILNYIQAAKPLNHDVIIQMKNIAFLPTLLKPNDWQLPWFLDKKSVDVFASTCLKCNKKISCTLSRPTDLFMDNCRNLVGCRELIIDLSTFQISLYPRNVLSEIGVRFIENVPVVTVVEQLREICQSMNPGELPDISKQLLGSVCSEMYKYLDNACKVGPIAEIENLKQFPCLLIDDTFVMPKQTAMSIPVKCSPKLYGLDRIHWKSYKFFLQMIGVKESFEEEDVIPILKDMSEMEKGVLNDASLNLACRLVELLANVHKNHISQEEYKNICIPGIDGILCPIRNLCLDDSTTLQMGKSLKFIHPKIKGADARKLGVQSKLSGSLMQNYVRQMRPFGQKEELSVRIKRILQQYPLSESVLKEMLQNADDAKATEVMFITDFNEYNTEKTFDSKWHLLQGPALLVYNNSYFTDEDIAGIQHLGRGSKGDDPTKTGQYGVGFNAVYHITDVPSFLSISSDKDKDTLCILDPNCQYVPGANEISPGASFINLDDLREPFRDVFTCYHEDILLQSPGTVFRLPLRTKQFAKTSDLSKKEVTRQTIENMLQNLKMEMEKSLLFLRNVKKITIASITNGKLEEEHCTELMISEEYQNKKSAFDEYVMEKAIQFQKEKEFFNKEQKNVSYQVTLKRKAQQDTQWCIIQAFGFDSEAEIPDSVQEAFDDDRLGLLPQGGVALPLHGMDSEDAAAFCFLPLPCQTGLTMHINGHFSLDNESRRGLWKDDKRAYRTEWNHLLLTHVIAPIYAKALEWLRNILDLNCSVRGKHKEIENKIEHFHSYFPDVQKASDHNWKILVNSVYKCIEKEEMKLFLSSYPIEIGMLELSCYSLTEENGYVLFRDTSTLMKIKNQNIVLISKGLGAKLVDTPFWVCTSIENAAINIYKFNPENLICFFKSPYCKLKNLVKDQGPLDLTSSSLKTIENVKTCLEFCMSGENANNDPEGIPLCLLETEQLVEFRCDRPILLTPFSQLIPSSKSQLLHPVLHALFENKHLNCIENLNLEKLVEYLPFDMDYECYRHKICKWNPQQTNIPNKDWLCALWQFLKGELSDIRDPYEMKRILHPILPWSIIPTTRVCGTRLMGLMNDLTKELYPLEDAIHVIDLDSFKSLLLSALAKLRLPVLDGISLPSGHVLRHLVATQDRVHDVLECLFVHRQLIEDNTQIGMRDCDTILEFLAGGLKQLLEMPNSQHLLDKLRKLPLFTTVYDQKINLEENRDILALPKGLPADGINTWAVKSQKILLRQNDRLKSIFEQFSVTEQSTCGVYVVHILPFFHNIPVENRLRHLEYIRDDLLRKSGEYNEEQNRLINALKKLSFVPHHDGSFKQASNFFSPFNELMTVMINDPSQFPPEPFSSWNWKYFMTLVGMKTEITKDLFLEFASCLQSQGCHSIPLSEEIKKKSRCLVRHLFQLQDLHTAEFLKRVSEIKFIAPHEMDPFYCNICPQPNDATNQLIPFKGSVRSKYLVTTWTQHRILPSWTDTCSRDASIGLSDLGVQKPTPKISLTHIETVCNYLGNLTDKNLAKMNIERISRMMTTFYEYASKANVLQLINLQTFRKIPFVFVRETPGLFPCDRFTFQLDECYKMKPYLMEIPVEHYGFYKLFEQLGATKTVSSNTFAKILEDIHCVSENLNPNEITMAQRAMKFFFQLLPSVNVSQMLETQDLFLLSKDCKLINARNIVYMDSIVYEKHLTNAEEHLCIMSEIDDVGSYALKTKIEKLPKRMQPQLISNLVEDKVDIKNAQISENKITKDIKAFFESREFINGVLRMVYYEKSQLKEEFPSEENISTITANLCAVKFRCVGAMEIVYILHGKEIGKKPCDNYFDTEEENGKKMWTVYLNFGVGNNLEMVVRKNQNLISKAIKECTGCKFSSTESDLLGLICAEVGNLDRIESILDDESIPPLDKKYKNASLPLPKPGDIVEIRWHCILDNDFISFEHGEYVAYISGINDRGDVEYKYAIIKEKLSCGDNSNFASLSQEYLVEIRPNEEKKMKEFELFKFNRSKDPDGENRNVYMEFQVEILHRQAAAEEEITDSQYCDNRSLEEIFKEIREQLKHAFTLAEKERRALCRRIMRKWHPDKQLNDVTRATQIFQYIRKIIQKLEVGENIDVDDTQEPRNSRHPWSDEVFNEFDRTYEREKTNEERYKRPRHPSSPGTRRHQPKNTYIPDPQPFTANTWLNEAKYDIRFAKQSEDTMDENNENEFFSWICQMCHQATEKALIAWQYMDDAKRIGRSENLASLAQSLPSDLRRLATDLENLTQGVRRMKYPDCTHIPSKAYTRDQAKRAMKIANEVIEKVDEHLQ
uniref:Sacsin-like n=1 Tax=Crassostrea virginica TaxID=6565 RepID=A0A8B8DNG7_CRAVI|nr:sacsin-like [Crassostrea virginica]XP_022329305.1 sacsin-like [Crassostrea virginica]XP_022329306.1 sacsin-like [Crassostrea virginica]